MKAYAPYLTVLFMISSGISFRISNELSYQSQPSCEELRMFWNVVRQARDEAHITNEIPIVPWELLDHSDHLQKLPRQKLKSLKSSYKTAVFQDPHIKERLSHIVPVDETLSNRVLSPGDGNTVFYPHDSPSAVRGTFGDFFQPHHNYGKVNMDTVNFIDSTDTAPDTKRRGDTLNVHLEAWGDPHNLETFGRIVGDVPLMPGTKVSKDTIGKWSEYPLGKDYAEFERKTCYFVENKICESDKQCLCEGTDILQCHEGRCITHYLDLSRENEYGRWHNEPLPRSHLGALLHRSKRTADESNV